MHADVTSALLLPFIRTEELNTKLENLLMNNRQAGVNQFKNKLIKITINIFVGQNPSAPNNLNLINKTKFLGVFLDSINSTGMHSYDLPLGNQIVIRQLYFINSIRKIG